jgi:nitrogen fixation protein FixH
MEANAPPRPLTGRRVLIYLVAFFGVVFAANAALVKFTIDTLPGVEVDSAYRASLAFNAETAAAQAQAQRGWRVVAHVERDNGGDARLRIDARDAAGVPLGGVGFTARLARPTDERGDRLFALVERETGIYAGNAAGVGPGQWDLVVEAARGSERVFLSRNRLVLQ